MTKLDKPVIIVGTGRCGSTVFHRLLAKHPDFMWLSGFCDRYPTRPAWNRRAVTALVRPAPADQATTALATKHSFEMIDEAKPGEVGVIVMEGSLDIAAMGNLMATAAVERGMAGMVLDGAIRDLWDVRRMGLTVYARSKSPRTAVGHYATVAKNVPVECAGVTVRPGDIIVADEDGFVVVPQYRAAEVLKRAQAIDQQESGMFPFIREFKSLSKAIAKFNRI